MAMVEISQGAEPASQPQMSGEAVPGHVQNDREPAHAGQPHQHIGQYHSLAPEGVAVEERAGIPGPGGGGPDQGSHDPVAQGPRKR